MLYSQFKKVISLIDTKHHTPMSEELHALFDGIRQPNEEQDWSLEPKQILEIAYIVTSSYEQEKLGEKVWLKNLFNQICDLLDECFDKAFVILTLRDVKEYLDEFFTKDTFIMAMASDDPNRTAQLIYLLYRNHINDPMLLDAVINNSSMWLGSIMRTLNATHTLNPTNIGYLLDCPDHHLAVYETALTLLMRKDIQISQNIIQALLADNCLNLGQARTYFSNFKNSIALLEGEHLLTTERVEWLLKSRALGIHSPFERLIEFKMLTLENADSIRLICFHQSPNFLLGIFSYLHTHQLLTLANATAVFDATSQFIHPWYETVFTLLPDPLVNQANFTNLIAFLPYVDGTAQGFLEQIPPLLLTQQVIDQLIELMRVNSQEQQLIELWQGENPHSPVPQFSAIERLELIKKSINRALSQFIQQFIMALEPVVEPAPLNTAQNTHATSIHKSAAESALELAQLYQDKLEDEESYTKALADLVVWGKSLDPNVLISRAAASALTRLLEEEFSYIEPRSKINVRQLLLLVWFAIQDDSNRIGNLVDAQNELMNALYEIQRGYNLNASGVDNKASEDLYICEPGAFNKLMEKMVSISPVVALKFITMGTASLKLPRVIKEQVLQHLMANKDHDLIEKIIKEQSLTQVVNSLLPTVTELMFTEFHSLFEGIEDSHLTAFIQAGFADFDVPVVIGAELERLKQEMIQASTTNEVKIPQSSNVNSFFASSTATQQGPSDEENLDPALQ
ncbi:MAG: hypothetical protein P4L79_13880 [Legionella sp.]|uniref:hypothetical protein n=1 Tax=Legionella sp. TaxID=459 RepID=UPI00284D89C1|nr:hypothetical protein [Legionella sp.]